LLLFHAPESSSSIAVSVSRRPGLMPPPLLAEDPALRKFTAPRSFGHEVVNRSGLDAGCFWAPRAGLSAALFLEVLRRTADC